MSMISSLIDELRKSADEWNGSNMFELARMCREAADTIWELRDDLQRANAENAKLRELLQRAVTSHNKMCTNRGTCTGCLLLNVKPLAPVCPIISVTRDARELGVEVEDGQA